MDLWDAHAAARLDQRPAGRLEPPPRMEWTQRPGIGPGAEILGEDLTGRWIVELGCGAGHNTAHLAAAGATVVGVDRSAGQIRRAAAHYGHTGAQFLNASATVHLGRSTERLDAVVSVFGAVGMTEPSRVLGACSRRLARRGVLAFSLPHPQRTGGFPISPRTRETVTLPDGAIHSVERWDMDPAAWSRALNRAGLLVTGVHHLYAPTGTRWPTALLITARKP
ncbi:class I SAM-dependent methyltransferase [Streptomyces sp. H39-S7]|uniref:class I SAM-dependent methyltransferase n=1 Tax=Streptomyces sp. H39-S7 TaxID=3004357 RepID=UPI0022B04541|nr:class I SAM-dependent methyltransferase [Streptomyces sp. H39-S7]MCZ4120209.1 class I SAM-dependent methyltransferase [Streptomyces sp. H39-S7]